MNITLKMFYFLGEVLAELPVSQIEVMLISQVLSILMVFDLRSGQLGYRRYMINFPQDVHNR